MRTIVLATALIADPIGFEWFENHWVSDGTISFRESVRINPSLQGFTNDDVQDFKDLFGKTFWRIENGTISVAHREDMLGTAPYSIRPTDEHRFEIVMDAPDGHTVMNIWRVDEGFCMAPSFEWLVGLGVSPDPVMVECYVPVGA